MGSWRVAQVDQILHWAEEGYLDAQQLARLEAVAPLHPQRATWLAVGERVCFFVGALLLECAVGFFFAYNWDALHRYTKMALAAAALLACVVVAAASRPASLGWQAALFATMLCTGALLALIGQIYQTGADIWELFAAWSVLMLPFALLARAWPNWLLCLLVSNLCLTRLLAQEAGLWLPGFQDTPGKLALWLGLNTLWWLAFVFAGRWLLNTPSRHMMRTTATLALTVLAAGAMLGAIYLGNRDGNGFVAYLWLFVPVAGTGFWYYRQRRLDIVMLGALCVATMAVAGSLLGRVLVEIDNMSFGMLTMAGFVVLTSGSASVWLKNLYRQRQQQALTESHA